MTANVYVILFICMYCRCWLVFGTGGPWRGEGVTLDKSYENRSTQHPLISGDDDDVRNII